MKREIFCAQSLPVPLTRIWFPQSAVWWDIHGKRGCIRPPAKHRELLGWMGLNCTPRPPPEHPHPAGQPIPPQKAPADAVSLHRAGFSQTLRGAVSSPGLCRDDFPSELGLFQTPNPSKQLSCSTHTPSAGPGRCSAQAQSWAGHRQDTRSVPGRAQVP